MKKEYVLLLIFAVVLVLFAVFSTMVGFHDSNEYIAIAKNFAGIKNMDLFTTHSLLYPFVISPFLKVWPSLTTIKLINCIWVFLIGLLLLLWLKDRRAFIIFAFSPLVWYVSIQTTPVLPAAFFFLLAYLFFKKEDIKYNFLYSGFFLGMACAFYDVLIFVGIIFLLVYFMKKRVIDLIKYLIFIVIGLLPRLILDYWLFGMPFYSLMKFFGTNTIISLGLSSTV